MTEPETPICPDCGEPMEWNTYPVPDPVFTVKIPFAGLEIALQRPESGVWECVRCPTPGPARRTYLWEPDND